jgi:5-methylcytosine-specific restriction endonuclease McrA
MTHRTLLLTPYYFPIGILRWEDAVKMRYEGTADVVAEYEQTVSSPSVTWRVPAVIRLRRMPAGKKRGIKFSRSNVYQRDGHRCQYCGNRLAESVLSYDHVVPRAAGGRTCWENIVTACRPCNTRKGCRTCDESGMWPLNEPRRPKSLPVQGPRIDREAAPVEWQAFLPAVKSGAA